jgi:Zn-finger nucleic acid-binding protein
MGCRNRGPWLRWDETLPLFRRDIMSQLVACPQCKLQYDIGHRPVGSRFRCHCGAAVTIRPPFGHDAAVDVPLRAEALTDAKTSLACPACGKGMRLGNRQMGDATVMECGRCAGLWLAADVFTKLIEKTSHDAVGSDWRVQPRRRAKLQDAIGRCGSFYRKCPSCSKLMNRCNYGRRSGVIVDACKNHGIWFDANELPQVLDWVRSGGLAKAQREAADELARDERRKSAQRLAAVRGPLTHELHEADEFTMPGLEIAGVSVPIWDILLLIARLFW